MTIRFFDLSVQMAAGLDRRACPVVVRDLRNTDRSFSLHIRAVNTVGDKNQNSRFLFREGPGVLSIKPRQSDVLYILLWDAGSLRPAFRIL